VSFFDEDGSFALDALPTLPARFCMPVAQCLPGSLVVPPIRLSFSVNTGGFGGPRIAHSFTGFAAGPVQSECFSETRGVDLLSTECLSDSSELESEAGDITEPSSPCSPTFAKPVIFRAPARITKQLKKVLDR
jgi:hypothetical protein